MGPRISSTLPTAVLFSRKIEALNWGILFWALTLLQTISPSQACMKDPISRIVSGGPKSRCP
jgi:hypothetical protein